MLRRSVASGQFPFASVEEHPRLHRLQSVSRQCCASFAEPAGELGQLLRVELAGIGAQVVDRFLDRELGELPQVGQLGAHNDGGGVLLAAPLQRDGVFARHGWVNLASLNQLEHVLGVLSGAAEVRSVRTACAS